MPNPYNITEVDIGGAIGAFETARLSRMRQLMMNQQMQQAERQAERDNSILGVLARHLAGGQAGGSQSGGSGSSSGTSSPAMPASARGNLAGLFGEPAGATPAPVPTAAPTAAPAPAGGGRIDLGRLGAELIAIDAEQGMQILTAFRQMNEAEHEQSERVNLSVARAAQHLLSVPETEWQSELQRIAPQLERDGVPAEAITNFQLSRRNLEFAISRARDIEKIREEARPDWATVEGEVIDRNVLPRPTAEDPVAFRSEFIDTPQGMYRRSDLTGRSGSAPSGPPQPGDVVRGFRFRGGNPNDRSSWEPVEGGAGRSGPRTFR